MTNLPAHRDDGQPARIIEHPTPPRSPDGHLINRGIRVQQAAQRFADEIYDIITADRCPVTDCWADLAGRDDRARARHMASHGLATQFKAWMFGWRG